MNTRNYLIIDTETTMSREVFDIGWLVCSKSGDVIVKREFVVQENFTKTFFFEKKRPLYNARIENLEITILPKRAILEILLDDIATYNAHPFAYNSPFDQRALKKLWGYELDIEDIIPYAFNIAIQKTYLKQNRRTPNGNITMNAENIYQYISKNDDFEEEHTALSDCFVEMEILLRAKRQHKKLHREISCNNAWIELNKRYEELI